MGRHDAWDDYANFDFGHGLACPPGCPTCQENAMTEHTKPAKIPDNWDSNGTSKGKQSGPVRPTPDASRPKK